MAHPHKWSPISYKSSAGQRKHIGQRPTLYRWTTQPTAAHAASLLQRRRSTEVNQTLHDVWPSPALVHCICILGALDPNRILPGAKFTLRATVQVLRSPILTALLHGTPAAGVSQTLRRGTRNGVTELSQRAPPIFGWAAITFGIGPHSSIVVF